MKKTLSVVLATYNEEENLAACLESVKDIADEIIIVDGTSTDKTVEIAKNFGAKVIITSNPPIFHINKQKAIDRATKDWILQLDADELVSKKLAAEIKTVLEKGKVNGYWMSRKNYFLGKFLMKGGQYPDYTLRLYRNGKGKLPQKDVHEQAVVEGKVEYLTEALQHYPYKDFSHYYEKWIRYCHLLVLQIAEEVEKKSLLQKFWIGLKYLIIKPVHWFAWTYLRHKGLMDGWSGFVFSLFSALRFPVAYAFYFKKKFRLTTFWIIVLFSLILLYAFYIRSMMLVHGDFFYLVDQARDLMLVKEIATTFNITLIGARAGIGGIFHGPLWLYMNVPLFLLTGGDPFWTLVPLFVVVSLSIIVAGFIVTLKLYDLSTAFLYALFLSISSVYVKTVPYTSNAQVMPLIFLLYLGTITFFLRGKNKALIASAFLIGLGFHFESAFAILLIPITLVACIIRFKKIPLQDIVLSVGAFFLAVSNFIVFELRHNFLMTQSVLTLFRGGIKPLKGFELYSNLNFRIFDRYQAYLSSLNAPFSTITQQTYLILFIVLVGSLIALIFEIIRTKRLSHENKEYLFIACIPIMIFLFYILYPFPLWEHYLLPVGVITILYFVLSVKRFFRNKYGIFIGILLLFFILKPTVQASFQQHSRTYQKDTTDGSYQNQLAVVDWVFQDANGKEFSYFVYMPSVFTYNMDYLFWWRDKHYKTIYSDKKKDIAYLIMYPESAEGAHEFWEKNVIHTTGPVLAQKQFQGGIVVKKIQTNSDEEPVDPNYYMNLIFR